MSINEILVLQKYGLLKELSDRFKSNKGLGRDGKEDPLENFQKRYTEAMILLIVTAPLSLILFVALLGRPLSLDRGGSIVLLVTQWIISAWTIHLARLFYRHPFKQALENLREHTPYFKRPESFIKPINAEVLSQLKCDLMKMTSSIVQNEIASELAVKSMAQAAIERKEFSRSFDATKAFMLNELSYEDLFDESKNPFIKEVNEFAARKQALVKELVPQTV